MERNKPKQTNREVSAGEVAGCLGLVLCTTITVSVLATAAFANGSDGSVGGILFVQCSAHYYARNLFSIFHQMVVVVVFRAARVRVSYYSFSSVAPPSLSLCLLLNLSLTNLHIN